MLSTSPVSTLQDDLAEGRCDIQKIQREIETKRTQALFSIIGTNYFNTINIERIIAEYSSYPCVNDVYCFFGFKNYQEHQDDENILKAEALIKKQSENKKDDKNVENDLVNIACIAAKSGHIKTLQYLYKVKKDYFGKLIPSNYLVYEETFYAFAYKNLLTIAIEHEQITLAWWFLKGIDNQWDLNARSSRQTDSATQYEKTPLSLCVNRNNRVMASYLLNQGADPCFGDPIDSLTESYGCSAPSAATAAYKSKNFFMLSLFAEFHPTAREKFLMLTADLLSKCKAELKNLFIPYLHPQGMMNRLNTYRHADRAAAVDTALQQASSLNEILTILESQDIVLKKSTETFPRSNTLNARWLDSAKVKNAFNSNDPFCRLLSKAIPIVQDKINTSISKTTSMEHK